MKKIRETLAILSLALLGLGYAGSTVAYFQGAPTEFAVKVDSPQVRALATLLLVSAIVLAILPNREETTE